jgi:YVTN family beta-propeller protein
MTRTVVRVGAALYMTALGACHRRADPPLRVFVSNEDSGTVTIIDPVRDEVIASIPVGKRPRGLRLSPDGKSLYVAVSGSPQGGPTAARHADVEEQEPDRAADGIAVVDLQQGRVVRVLASGPDPESFDVSADGKTLYVSNEDSGALAIVDVATGTVVRTAKVGGEPEGVAITRDGKFVYVASEASSEIDVVRVGTGEIVTRIPTAMRPRSIAFDSDGTHAIVTAELGGQVHIIDTHAHAIVGSPIRTGKDGVKPMGVAIAPDGTRAYVTNGREGSVAVIDLGSQRLERSIDQVGARPWGIAITPDGKKVYVAAGRDVAVVDPASGAVTKRIAAGDGTWGVVVGGGLR